MAADLGIATCNVVYCYVFADSLLKVWLDSRIHCDFMASVVRQILSHGFKIKESLILGTLFFPFSFTVHSLCIYLLGPVCVCVCAIMLKLSLVMVYWEATQTVVDVCLIWYILL